MDLAQCIGPHEWTYSIFPHKGDWTNGVFQEADELNLPLDPAQCGPHKGTLPKAQGFLSVSGGNVQLTAFKRHEDRDKSYVVRVFNPEDKPVAAQLKFAKPVKKAWLTNLNEERRDELKPKGSAISLKLAKKKIVTVEVTF
ncbi:MAG: glycosyl hydrolase-related protein [Candidatus Hydrogenedentales bacterium]|jgi:alpha-mannosidase